MIDRTTIDRAIQVLLDASPRGTSVILFGSYAEGRAGEDSDLDFLVVQPTLTNRRGETVRLRALLRPLRVPVDVMVVSRAAFEAWKDLPNNLVNEAWTRGVIYGEAPEPGASLRRQGA